MSACSHTEHAMAPKLRNKAFRPDEVRHAEWRESYEQREAANEAREVAKVALMLWYETSYANVERDISKMQIDSNSMEIDGDSRNGYVWLTALFDGAPKPIPVLDYEQNPTGRLTYRQLHQQVRQALCLEPKVFLRMCPFRPWYRHVKTSFPVPEHCALPVRDAQCTHLLGTTLLYYAYV